MRKNLFIVLAFIIPAVCKASGPAVNITANIRNSQDQKVYVMEHNRHNTDYSVADSTEIRDGRFRVTLENAYPRDILLVFEEARTKVIRLYVEAGDIKIEGDYNDLNRVRKTGTPTLDLQTEVDGIIFPIMDQLGAINKRLGEMDTEAEYNYTEKLQREGDSLVQRRYMLQSRIEQVLDSVIVHNNDNVMAADLLMRNQPMLDLRGIEALLGRLSPDMPANYYLDLMTSLRNRLKSVEVGAVAPEIVLRNENDQEVRLSSLRGNIVMVNFWTLWSPESKQSNEGLLELYDRYKDMGFIVYSVSMDENAEEWKKAIRERNYDWINVKEITGGYMDLYSAYMPPTTYLLDEDGRIVGKNLSLKETEAFLSKKLD